MSDEYIKKGPLMKFIEDGLNNRNPEKAFGHDAIDIMTEIHFTPAAPVREVKFGHWIGIDEFPHEDWECDCCGEQVCGNANIPEEMYFCPNCGADMRGEEGTT